MLPMDWLAVGIWIAAIVAMLALAWEPWRQTRRQASIDLSDDAVGRAVSPLYVFVLPAAVAIGPFFAQIVRHDRISVWPQPHLLLPHALVGLAVLIAFQAYLRGRILAVVRRRREAKAQALATFNAGRRS